MKNCIILGSGRSGTSMVAGCLSGCGYYMGDRIMPPTPSNPKGYFEAFDIEEINEDILCGTIKQRPKGATAAFLRTRPRRPQNWLARVNLNKPIYFNQTIQDNIISKTRNRPFCFKDPRFSYTLPVWRELYNDIVFICVFRHPGVTVNSILKECKREKYLEDLHINKRIASTVWNLQYRHILNFHMKSGDWCFIHYEQILNGAGLERIQNITQADIKNDFPDKALKRTTQINISSSALMETYRELCCLAGYQDHE